MLDKIIDKLADGASKVAGELGSTVAKSASDGCGNDTIKLISQSAIIGGQFGGVHGAIVGGVFGTVAFGGGAIYGAFDKLVNHKKYEAEAERQRQLEEERRLIQEIYDDGLQKFEIGDYRGAVHKFDRAISLSPRDNFYFHRGYAYFYLKEYKKAWDDCSHAIQIDPKFADAYDVRGCILATRNDKWGAKAELKMASSLYHSSGDMDSYRAVRQKIIDLKLPPIRLKTAFQLLILSASLLIPIAFTWQARNYYQAQSVRQSETKMINEKEEIPLNPPEVKASGDQYNHNREALVKRIQKDSSNKQPTLISPSPIPTQPVSKTTKKVTKTLPINVSTTKYVYPSEAIANYVDVCTKAGGMKGSCTCFIEKVQNNYALDELVRLNQEIAKGAKPPKSLIKINEQCEQEQLKQMGEALGKMIPTHKYESSYSSSSDDEIESNNIVVQRRYRKPSRQEINRNVDNAMSQLCANHENSNDPYYSSCKRK